MRKNRVVEQNRCYHLVSRLAHRAFFLDDEEKDRAVALMRRVEAGVQASMSYCINRTVSISSDPFAPASSGEDICYVNVSVRDAEGLVVPDAKLPVKFEIEGPGEIVATDNGDETDFDDFRSPIRRTFNGWVQAIVRPIPGTVGDIKVRVTSDGLEPCEVEIGVRAE